MLGLIAVDWIDIPHNALLYSTTGGAALRQAEWRTRARLFNTFQFLESFDRELTWFKGLDTMDCTPLSFSLDQNYQSFVPDEQFSACDVYRKFLTSRPDHLRSIACAPGTQDTKI